MRDVVVPPAVSQDLILALLADARLPSGAHTQSAGLEPALRAGLPPPWGATGPAPAALVLSARSRQDAAPVERGPAWTGRSASTAMSG